MADGLSPSHTTETTLTPAPTQGSKPGRPESLCVQALRDLLSNPPERLSGLSAFQVRLVTPAAARSATRAQLLVPDKGDSRPLFLAGCTKQRDAGPVRRLLKGSFIHPGEASWHTFPDLSGGALDICEDQLHATTLEQARREVLKIVVHELTHATDQIAHGADFSSCAAVACSEVRAYDLGGQCDDVEPGRKRRECVQSGAEWSSIDVCGENTAPVVLGVFEHCYGTPMEHNFTAAGAARLAAKTAAAGLK